MNEITFSNVDYYRAKRADGKKYYFPYVYFRGHRRVLRKPQKYPFQKAAEACDYAASVVNRYNRIFSK